MRYDYPARYAMYLDGLNQHLYGYGANSTDKIKINKTLGAYTIFKYGAKHEQGEHIEKYMSDTAMHEHVANNLP